MKILVATVLAAIAVGIASHGAVAQSAQTIIGPSGESLTVVKCKSNSRQCMAEARQICRGSYQVYDSDSHAGGLAADAIPGPVTWYSMTFRCGRSDGRLPRFRFTGPVYQPAPVYIPRRDDRDYRYRDGYYYR